jgi:hypothetical protein
MSGQLWVVRAGEGAKYVDEFMQGSYLAINFAVLANDDLSAVDEGALRARAATAAERAYAGQLVAFVFRIVPGDVVIVPRITSRHRDYLVAEVSGPYQYELSSPPSGHHRRSVRWLGTFRRDALSAAATKTMDAMGTIFRPTAAEPELRDLLTALVPFPSMPATSAWAVQNAAALTRHDVPPASDVVIGVAPLPRPLSGAQLEVVLDTQGRARIVSGHPALVMEQTPRHVEPAADWRGVPGIYVLTGTDLRHSSTRTGNERTLTTTTIVRPWAYVGLSEDFLGRIGSHRQGKQEWRRALLVRSGAQPFSSDDIKYLERAVHAVLDETGEVILDQAPPRGNLSAQPRNPPMLEACAETIVAVLRLTGTLI